VASDTAAAREPRRDDTQRSVAERTPVVLLHGFTQTGACLGPLADDLATDRTVLTPDLPGHGDAAEHAGADLWGAAELVATAIRSTSGNSPVGTRVATLIDSDVDTRVDIVGYSMGGRVALHLVLAHPELVRRIVTIGATAGIDDDTERAERRARDHELADRLERIGIDEFLAEWLALPMFAALPDWARFDDERGRNTAAGLAGSLRHAGTGSMEPLWDRLGADGGIGNDPLLALAGADDERFAALADRLAAIRPAHGRSEQVPGAGHAAHLERPDATISLVRSHLDAT
jgi:2-succinyl-6-hydroxy-2,4-cyclohexadiene-1-carboxylate synthase